MVDDTNIAGGKEEADLVLISTRQMMNYYSSSCYLQSYLIMVAGLTAATILYYSSSCYW